MNELEAFDFINDNEIDLDNPAPIDFKIPVKDIIDKPEEFEELIEILSDDKNILLQQFNKLYKLMSNI